MSWFRQNLFSKWFTQYHKTEDSYKDLQGRGLLERYVQTIGQEIDTNILPYLENLQDNILQPKSIFAKLLPFREQELGVNLVYDDTVDRRKQILQYWLRLVQIKGTKRGYEVCIRLMNFNGLIIDTVDVITYFDNPLPSAGCNACYEYDVIVKGNKEIIDLTIVDAFFNLIDWNEPINCKLRYFIYNDTYVPKKLVQFLFKGFDDENLYVDIKRNPEFKAKLDTLLDNQGDLLLEDEFAEFYQYDSEFWYNQGYMLFNKPTPDAYLPFLSLTTTNVTQTNATVTWESEPDALFYVLNVGLDLKDDGNEIITSKIIDNLNVGLVLSYDLTGLTPNTPYYTQIKAVREDNKQALSHPQAFITMRNVDTPTALPYTDQTSINFVANWIALTGINGYEVQISDSNTFTTILDTITVIGNFNNVLVELPNTQTYYYRVRAYKDREGRLPVVKSYSNWSNVIPVILLEGVALRFDGVNDYVYCPNTGLPIGNSEVSVYAKFTIKQNVNYDPIVNYGGSSFFSNFGIGVYEGRIGCSFGSGTFLRTNEIFPNGTYEVVITKTFGVISAAKVYVNGEQKTTTFLGTDGIANFENDRFFIGQWSQTINSLFAMVDIEEVRIWNRELNPTEVLTPKLISSGLIRDFQFNSNEGTTLYDSSLNELHGTLINFANTDRGIGNAWIDENGNSVL